MKYTHSRLATAALTVAEVVSLSLAQWAASGIRQPLLREDAMTPYLIAWEIAWILSGIVDLTCVVLILFKKIRFDPWIFGLLVLGVLTCLWLDYLPATSSGA
jgi:hypothetical protein